MNNRRTSTVMRLACSVALAVIVSAGGSKVVTACPNCGTDALASQPNGAGLVTGYTIGAIGLAGAPFILAGSVIVYLIRAFGRAPKD